MKKREYHGGRKRPEYRSWYNMIQRCTNSRNNRYPNYGGRGISVCEEWRNSFAAFLAYVGERPSSQHSVDRINNDGNYEPGNVRWATPVEQAANQDKTLLLTIGGETHSLSEWARIKGIPMTTLHSRIRRLGWSFDKAIAECGA